MAALLRSPRLGPAKDAGDSAAHCVRSGMAGAAGGNRGRWAAREKAPATARPSPPPISLSSPRLRHTIPRNATALSGISGRCEKIAQNCVHLPRFLFRLYVLSQTDTTLPPVQHPADTPHQLQDAALAAGHATADFRLWTVQTPRHPRPHRAPRPG